MSQSQNWMTKLFSIAQCFSEQSISNLIQPLSLKLEQQLHKDASWSEFCFLGDKFFHTLDSGVCWWGYLMSVLKWLSQCTCSWHHLRMTSFPSVLLLVNSWHTINLVWAIWIFYWMHTAEDKIPFITFRNKKKCPLLTEIVLHCYKSDESSI